MESDPRPASQARTRALLDAIDVGLQRDASPTKHDMALIYKGTCWCCDRSAVTRREVGLCDECYEELRG